MMRFNPGKYGADGSCMELNDDGRYVRYADLPVTLRGFYYLNRKLMEALGRLQAGLKLLD